MPGTCVMVFGGLMSGLIFQILDMLMLYAEVYEGIYDYLGVFKCI